MTHETILLAQPKTNRQNLGRFHSVNRFAVVFVPNAFDAKHFQTTAALVLLYVHAIGAGHLHIAVLDQIGLLCVVGMHWQMAEIIINTTNQNYFLIERVDFVGSNNLRLLFGRWYVQEMIEME